MNLRGRKLFQNFLPRTPSSKIFEKGQLQIPTKYNPTGVAKRHPLDCILFCRRCKALCNARELIWIVELQGSVEISGQIGIRQHHDSVVQNVASVDRYLRDAEISYLDGVHC